MILTMKDKGANTRKMIPPRHPVKEPHPGLIMIKTINVTIGTSERMNPTLLIILLYLLIYGPGERYGSGATRQRRLSGAAGSASYA